MRPPNDISNEDLWRVASSMLNPRRIGDFEVAHFACALLSCEGKMFTGACVGGYLGICAEQAAVGAMVSAGPPQVAKIVAVRRDDSGVAAIVRPCGRCREFLRLLAPENLDTEVILGPTRVVKLRELLPLHDSEVQIP